MKKAKALGRPRKYNYEGKKKVVSIRLTDKEKELILKNHENIQAFVQEMIVRLSLSKL